MPFQFPHKRMEAPALAHIYAVRQGREEAHVRAELRARVHTAAQQPLVMQVCTRARDAVHTCVRRGCCADSSRLAFARKWVVAFVCVESETWSASWDAWVDIDLAGRLCVFGGRTWEA